MRPISGGIVLFQLSQIAKAFIAPLYLQRERLPFKPTFVSLEVEETCFFRCRQCEIWKNKRAADRMSAQQMKKVLDKLRRWLGVFQLSFTGGEPFSNPHFISVIEHAAKLGIITHVNTNAYLINSQLVDRIVGSGINSLSISIDGLSQTHNQNRGRGGAFERAEAAIKMLKWGKKKRHFFLSTTTIIMKPNIGQLDRMLRWGKEIGLDGMLFQPLWERFATAKHQPNWFKKDLLWPEPEEAVKAIRQLILRKKQGWPVENTFSQLKAYFEYYRQGPIRYGKLHPCFVGIRNFSVAINGDVRLCFFFEPIGNILRGLPEEIWNGRKAREMRQLINHCQRGCKILLCNTEMNRSEAIKLLVQKGKRFLRRRILGLES